MQQKAADLTDELLVASRALVGAAARSLADLDITLPQYRAVVVVAQRPGLGVGDLAEALEVHPTTATRMCDRLVAKRLLRRRSSAGDRRATELHLTAAGWRLLERVADRRRRAIAEIVARMEPGDSAGAVRALRAFSEAAGESGSTGDPLGWSGGPS